MVTLGVGLVVDGETLVAVIRGGTEFGLRIHGSVVAVILWWDGFKAVPASIDARVFVSARAAGKAPYHLMPFPPPNHHGYDYAYDGTDDTGDFSHRQFVALVAAVVGITAVGVGRAVGSLGGT